MRRKTKHTLFVSIKKNALGFKDENDVFWVRTIHDSGRFSAKELVRFVNFLKHVLEEDKMFWRSNK